MTNEYRQVNFRGFADEIDEADEYVALRKMTSRNEYIRLALRRLIAADRARFNKKGKDAKK